MVKRISQRPPKPQARVRVPVGSQDYQLLTLVSLPRVNDAGWIDLTILLKGIGIEPTIKHYSVDIASIRLNSMPHIGVTDNDITCVPVQGFSISLF